MRLFSGNQKKPQKVILPKDAKCDRCGKKLKESESFLYLDGTLYCEKCGRAKRDWEFLELMAMLED